MIRSSLYKKSNGYNSNCYNSPDIFDKEFDCEVNLERTLDETTFSITNGNFKENSLINLNSSLGVNKATMKKRFKPISNMDLLVINSNSSDYQYYKDKYKVIESSELTTITNSVFSSNSIKNDESLELKCEEIVKNVKK